MDLTVWVTVKPYKWSCFILLITVLFGAHLVVPTAVASLFHIEGFKNIPVNSYVIFAEVPNA